MLVDGLQINKWSRATVQEVQSGGIDVVHATCGVWEDTAGALTRIGDWRHFARENSDIVRIVKNVQEMDSAKNDGVLAVLLGFQNSSMLGDDPEMAGIFADIGIRIIQLTYNISNHLGSSCWESEDAGLTRLSHRMVSEFNEVGILIDISHVGNLTGLEAIENSEYPVAVTHGNPSSFHDSPRNKPDHLLEALASRGTAERIGVDHVAVGSDSVLGWEANALGWMRSGRWDRPKQVEDTPSFPTWPTWFKGPEDFSSLAEGLSEVGFSSGEVDKVLGANWLRVFEKVFK